MKKSKKLEQRCGYIGREFFAFLQQKAFVPLGCILADIRFVAAFADMNNYLSQAAPRGLTRQNSNAMYQMES